jgi:hypothetical protein
MDRNRSFPQALEHHGLVIIMVRFCLAGDDAAMESFLGLSQINVFERQSWGARQQLWSGAAVWVWIDYKNRGKCSQTSLSRLSAIGFETETETILMLAPAA